MNKFLLYLVMLPSALWRSMGADIVQLKAILGVKLMLDDRKPMGFGRQKKQKQNKATSVFSSLIFLVMGFFYMFPLKMVNDRIFSLTLYFTLLMSMITFMLISDFSNVLFDSREKYILFPRPINDKTLVLARLLHVFIYLFRVVIPISLPGWIMLGYMDGWKSALLFLLPLTLLVFLVLFFVNSIYLLVLRVSKPEKFKDTISYFQVFTSILFFGSVYILPRLFEGEGVMNLNILKYPWLRFIPSYWLANCWSWIGFPVLLSGTWLFSILAILFPLGCLYVMIKYLSPQFSSRIAGIDNVDGLSAVQANGQKKKVPGKLYKQLAYLLNKDGDAQAGFMIAWLQTSRSRSFRMKVYPSFAFIPIYFVFMITQGDRSISDILTKVPDKPIHLILLYYSSFVIISAMQYLVRSDQYKAAWVYYSTPIEVPGRIMMGAFKAILVKYFLPFFGFLSIYVFYVWGMSGFIDVLLSFVNDILFVSVMARINLKHLPFSLIEEAKTSGGRVMKSMFAMIILGGLGMGHYFCVHIGWLKLIFLGLSSILLWLVWTSYAATTWAKMIKGEVE